MSRYDSGDDIDDVPAGDTDDADSPGSDELHETRPNRWTGAPSTWRTYTEEDRQTYIALEALRNNDLSSHLYNAFALRRPGLRSADRVPNSMVRIGMTLYHAFVSVLNFPPFCLPPPLLLTCVPSLLRVPRT